MLSLEEKSSFYVSQAAEALHEINVIFYIKINIIEYTVNWAMKLKYELICLPMNIVMNITYFEWLLIISSLKAQISRENDS